MEDRSIPFDTGTFLVEITLGNAAMSEPAHVARALRQVADRIDPDGFPASSFIRDENGNTCGTFWREGGPGNA